MSLIVLSAGTRWIQLGQMGVLKASFFAPHTMWNIKTGANKSIAPAASAWAIASRLLKWYQCSGEGWKLQEENVELNCWQQESQYISRSSDRLLVLHDIPTPLSWIVSTHCLTLSWAHFSPSAGRKIVLQQGYETGGTPVFGSQVVLESSSFCMLENCHQKRIKWSHL